MEEFEFQVVKYPRTFLLRKLFQVGCFYYISLWSATHYNWLELPISFRYFVFRQWLEGIFPRWNRSLFCRKTLFRVVHNFRFNSKWKTPIIQGWIKKIIHFEFRELITLLKLVRILLLEISLNWIRFGTERCEL